MVTLRRHGFALVGTLFMLEPTAIPVTPPPRHFSVLIGIGAYRHSAEWTDLSDLSGPRNDVFRVRRSLRRWGFTSEPDRQRVLLDEQASREAIAEALAWLTASATDSTDVVVVYYSGHGSWAPDSAIDDIRRRDESERMHDDRFDEALVPWDARDVHDPEQLVLDDEVSAWLDGIRTRNVTMIVDACFSGTVTRGIQEQPPGRTLRARGPAPPAFAIAGNGSMDPSEKPGPTLLSAAAAWELAYERAYFPGGVVSGVFTRELTAILDRISPVASLDDVLREVRQAVGPIQTPQVSGESSERLFRVGVGLAVPANSWIEVGEAAGHLVSLDIGVAHGLIRGTLLEAFPPGELGFRGTRSALLQVTAVDENTATARTIDGPKPPAGSRAIISRVPGALNVIDRLSVFVDPAAGELARALRELDWVELTDRPEQAMAEILPAGDGVAVSVAGDLVLPLSADVTAGFTTPARAGNPHWYRGTAAAVCGALRRAYAIVSLHLTPAAAPMPGLRVQLRLAPAGQTAPPPTTATIDTVRIGGRYDLWALVEVPPETALRQRLHLSVALSGYTDHPVSLWPRNNLPNSPLLPEQLNVPLLVFPNLEASPPAGLEILTAVVATVPFDSRATLSRLPTCPAGRSREVIESDAMLDVHWVTTARRVAVLPGDR